MGGGKGWGEEGKEWEGVREKGKEEEREVRGERSCIFIFPFPLRHDNMWNLFPNSLKRILSSFLLELVF